MSNNLLQYMIVFFTLIFPVHILKLLFKFVTTWYFITFYKSLSLLFYQNIIVFNVKLH